MVVRKACRPSYSEKNSEITSMFLLLGTRWRPARRGGTVNGPSPAVSDQAQASNVFGGFVAASSFTPDAPRFLSKAFCHSPESTIFFSAVLTLLQVSVSPFFRP